MPISLVLQAEEANARLVAATLATDQEQQTAKLQESLGSSNTQCETFAAFPESPMVLTCWLHPVVYPAAKGVMLTSPAMRVALTIPVGKRVTP